MKVPNLSITSFTTISALIYGFFPTLGFWSVINFNILPFMSLLDLSKSAIMPSLAFIAIMSICLLVNLISNFNDKEKNLLGSKSSVFSTKTLITYLIFNFISLLIIIRDSLDVLNQKNIVILLFPIFTIMCLILSIFCFFNEKILREHDQFTRAVFLFVFFMFPTLLFNNGKSEAKKIISGEHFYYIPNQHCDGSSKNMRFLNFYSEKTVSISPSDGYICISKDNNIELKPSDSLLIE